jgi:hypothetical protein
LLKKAGKGLRQTGNQERKKGIRQRGKKREKEAEGF